MKSLLEGREEQVWWECGCEHRTLKKSWCLEKPSCGDGKRREEAPQTDQPGAEHKQNASQQNRVHSANSKAPQVNGVPQVWFMGQQHRHHSHPRPTDSEWEPAF